MKNQNKLESLIKEAIKKCPDKKTTAIAVSGGVDSGLLLALGKYTNVVSVRLPFGPRYDEMKYTDEVVSHLGIKSFQEIILEENNIKEELTKAVKIIGTPIPHFNIYPFYKMCEKLAEVGMTDLVVGDGPDESMCGYTRHLIMDYLYNSFLMEAFKQYGPTIAKVLPSPQEAYAKIINKDEVVVSSLMNTGTLINDMCNVDMKLMRPDMTIMTNKLAEHFGITIHRPYESPEVDEFMFNLPKQEKIHYPWGKMLLRKIAEKYLPEEIAWRVQKIGGPLCPVNQLMGWNDIGEFDKSRYLQFQREVLSQ